MNLPRHYQPWRKLVGTTLILLTLGLPFLRMKGESALRFDIPSLTLHLFGSRIAMDEFFIVLLAILALSFLIILITILFGRIWCGWLCPQTVISDMTRFVDRIARRGLRRLIVTAAVMFPVSALLAANVLWYFVAPYDFIRQIASGSMNVIVRWSWAVLTGVIFLNFMFLRRSFCATVCPYAKMQGTLYDEQTMVITMDPKRRDECMGCEACVTSCPVNIDVREGVQSACITCAECIDACAYRMKRRDKPSLIEYRFGIIDGKLNIWRKGVLFSAAGSLVFLVLLIFLLFDRTALELMVLPDTRSLPRLSQDGSLINNYIVTITNRTDRDSTFVLEATSGTRKLLVIPQKVFVQRNGHERFSVTIKTLESFSRNNINESIIISIGSQTNRELFAQQITALLPPQ